MVEPKEVEAELMAAIEKLRGVIHFSPACHVFVILLAQPMHHFVGGRALYVVRAFRTVGLAI
jgi:hypothetical protein